MYLGETQEESILSMSIPFFNSVIDTLGRKINYDAVVNYAGNAFCEKSHELIQQSNPMLPSKKNRDNLSGLSALLSGKNIQVVHTKRTAAEALASPPPEMK